MNEALCLADIKENDAEDMIGVVISKLDNMMQKRDYLVSTTAHKLYNTLLFYMHVSLYNMPNTSEHNMHKTSVHNMQYIWTQYV